MKKSIKTLKLNSFIIRFLLVGLYSIVTSFACIPTAKSESIVVGTWKNEITVGTNPVYINMITFKKDSNGQIFLDQNNHSGDWSIKGDSITWVYRGIPKLKNTFTGRISKDGKTMEGINYGTWNDEEFEGKWKAYKE